MVLLDATMYYMKYETLSSVLSIHYSSNPKIRKWSLQTPQERHIIILPITIWDVNLGAHNFQVCSVCP
jgi:hypothetical protein